MKHRMIMTTVAALLVAGTAMAQEQVVAKFNLFGPIRHPVSQDAVPPFVERVEAGTDGAIKVKPIFGGALFGAAESLDGVKGRGTELANLVMGYYPAEFRYGTLISNLAMVGSEPLAVAAAVGELAFFECAGCQKEFEAQNIVYLGGFSTSVYSLITKEPLNSLEDLKGKRVRAAGSVWDRWLHSVGAIPVNIPTSEIFDGLSRGILDGTIVAPSALRSQSLWDVAKHLNTGPLGTYTAGIFVSANKDFYGELSAEQRKVMLEAAAHGTFDATWGYVNADKEVIKAVDEHGVTVSPLGPDVLQSFKDFNEADLKELAATTEETLGITDAAEVIAQYTQLYNKWEQKLREADALEDKSKAAEIYIDDVVSRLDPETYGL